MNSRRLTPCIGLPPLGWAADTYRILNLAQSGGQVLGANLNCSESERPLILKGLALIRCTVEGLTLRSPELRLATEVGAQDTGRDIHPRWSRDDSSSLKMRDG